MTAVVTPKAVAPNYNFKVSYHVIFFTIYSKSPDFQKSVRKFAASQLSYGRVISRYEGGRAVRT